MYQVYFSYNDEQVWIWLAEFKTMARAKTYMKKIMRKNGGVDFGQGYHVEHQGEEEIK